MYFVNLKETEQEMIAEWAEHEKAASLVYFKDGDVCLKDIRDEGIVQIYEVPLKDCETVYGFCKWYFHLKEKIWVTDAMLYHFAKTVCRELTGYEGHF